MKFKDVEIEDAAWAVPLLEAGGARSCEYSFANLFMWKPVYGTQIARFENFAVVRDLLEDEYAYYQFPMGTGDLKAVITAVIQDAEQLGKELILSTIPVERLEELEAMFPGYFTYESPLGARDYVYLTSDLANLAGRKFQKKRNHCSKFLRSYPNWSFEAISDDTIEEVCAFSKVWRNLHENQGIEGLEIEKVAIRQACQNYRKLRLQGGLLKVDGEVVAFSFGTPLGEDMFVVHVEKALYDVDGAYAMINREMARLLPDTIKYINRENDEGEVGLRIAKRSYQPVMLVEKIVAKKYYDSSI